MASTIKDIAEIANVSRGTVDKVIHNRSGVSSETRAKVLAIIKELDYHPNPIGKALKIIMWSCMNSWPDPTRYIW